MLEWNQLDKIYSLIKDSEDNPILRDKYLLTIVQIMLSDVSISSNKLTSINEMDMFNIFSLYNKIADSCRVFYCNSMDALSPQKRMGAFGKKIDDINSQISSYENDVTELLKMHSDLLNSENLYYEKKKEYDSIKSKISELENMKQLLTPKIFEKIEEENKNLEKEILEKEAINNNLQQMEKKLKEEILRIDSVITQMDDEDIKLEDRLIKYLDSIDKEIEAKLNSRNIKLDELKNNIKVKLNEYNVLLAKIDEFIGETNELESTHENNIKEYKKHFKENNSVWGAMSKHLSAGIPEVKKHISSLEDTIKKNLSDMDEILKNIISTSEELNKEIKRLNKTNIVG